MSKSGTASADISIFKLEAFYHKLLMHFMYQKQYKCHDSIKNTILFVKLAQISLMSVFLNNQYINHRLKIVK